MITLQSVDLQAIITLQSELKARIILQSVDIYMNNSVNRGEYSGRR